MLLPSVSAIIDIKNTTIYKLVRIEKLNVSVQNVSVTIFTTSPFTARKILDVCVNILIKITRIFLRDVENVNAPNLIPGGVVHAN